MILMINNEAMPSPSKLYVVYSDIKTDEQNAAGGTVTDYIATKTRVECEWSYVTRENLKWLLDHTTGVFTLSYFDPLKDELTDISCSVGERSIGAIRYINNIPVWGLVKMTFTER